MSLKKRQLSAIQKIVSRARLNDVRYSGELNSNGLSIITDGKVALFSRSSILEYKCIGSDEDVISFLSKIYNCISDTNSSTEYDVTSPFALSNLASTLPGLCKQYGKVEKYRTVIEFKARNKHEELMAVFDSRDLQNAFYSVGRKATGKIISHKDIYEGMPFLVVRTNESSPECVVAVVLQSNDSSSLLRKTTIGIVNKVEKAIGRIKTMEPHDGYYLAFSGGKDSQCIYHLAKMAGVVFDAHYSVTTVDPPELIRFIKKEYPDVRWDYPIGADGKRTSMFKLISEEHTIPPTRINRYCCSILKENGGIARLVMTGVRWDESIKRRDSHGVVDIITSSKKIHDASLNNNSSARANKFGSVIFMDDNEDTRKTVEYCYIKKKTTLNPIIDWTDEDVWEFLNNIAKVPHCCLYDEGYTRLGCVGCPLAGADSMKKDFIRWPQYKNLYLKAFEKMIENHKGNVKTADGEIVKCGESQKIFDQWIRWNSL